MRKKASISFWTDVGTDAGTKGLRYRDGLVARDSADEAGESGIEVQFVVKQKTFSCCRARQPWASKAKLPGEDERKSPATSMPRQNKVIVFASNTKCLPPSPNSRGGLFFMSHIQINLFLQRFDDLKLAEPSHATVSSAKNHQEFLPQ